MIGAKATTYESHEKSSSWVIPGVMCMEQILIVEKEAYIKRSLIANIPAIHRYISGRRLLAPPIYVSVPLFLPSLGPVLVVFLTPFDEADVPLLFTFAVANIGTVVPATTASAVPEESTGIMVPSMVVTESGCIVKSFGKMLSLPGTWSMEILSLLVIEAENVVSVGMGVVVWPTMMAVPE